MVFTELDQLVTFVKEHTYIQICCAGDVILLLHIYSITQLNPDIQVKAKAIIIDHNYVGYFDKDKEIQELRVYWSQFAQWSYCTITSSHFEFLYNLAKPYESK